MSVQEKKSFFSTIPGLVTGVAGLLTGVVGLITVSTQLGWIGGDDGGGSGDEPAAESTATTGRSGGTAGPSGGGGTTVANLSFEATPRRIDFGGLAGDEQEVTVRNTGNGTVRFEPFTITGANRDQFRIGQNDCGTSLNQGRTCTVTVTFLKTRPGESTGTLVIQPAGTSPPAQEIPLKGTRLL
ncbi:MAG: choice-of-anchor D domain-containing protein [Acidimicrobiia bacterium]